MSADDSLKRDELVKRDGSGRLSLSLLTDEATRQLTICNACRYCEGLCAVFPALGRRNVIEDGDVTQLANLCHDCRACFDACMYSAPHEFDLDLPKILSEVRVVDYERYIWPRRVPRVFTGWAGVLFGGVVSSLIVLVIAVAHAGWSAVVAGHDTAASPYSVIPYGALITLMSLAGLYSVLIMALGVRKYWGEIGGSPGPFRLQAVLQAVWYAATLRYLRGGGVDCYYPEDDKPSAARRNLHAFVSYGFGLCFVSTVAAGVLQDFMHVDPPYSWLSLPVMSGTVGGIGLVIGCIGLLHLKARSSAVTSVKQMNVKDYGLLVSLAFLALSGLAVLLARESSLFGVAFLVHMAALVEAFAMAPYSKFVHIAFRFAALIRDNLERAQRS